MNGRRRSTFESRKQMERFFFFISVDLTVLSQLPVKQHTLINSLIAACASSQISEGVFVVHPTEGHKTGISRSVLLISAATSSIYIALIQSL